MSAEVWEQVYDRLAELIEAHRTTLVFVNTRRLAERVTRQLSERLGDEHVTAHHGSLAKEQRLDAEQRLKRGELKALVATASLELGIDIGDVDLVCQLGSPRSIATFLQRVGPLRPRRRRHAQGPAVPALARRAGRMRGAARQRARAASSTGSRSPSSRSTCWRSRSSPRSPRASGTRTRSSRWSAAPGPTARSPREDFAAVVGMLADGFSTRRGRRGALIHHDAVNRVLRGRRGARLTALTSGGTIPDNADYQVLLEPENQVIGTRERGLRGREPGRRHLPARQHALPHPRASSAASCASRTRTAQPPTIPFWLGEAPGRSDELSASVSRLRGDDRRAPAAAIRPGERALRWLVDEVGIAAAAAEQLVEYLAAGARRARLPADARHDRARALLRRGRRHAARHPLALRQPHQPRLGPGAAQALLPQVQLRAAGGGDRGHDRALAHHRAQLRARRRRRATCTRRRVAAAADPGAARRADVRHALALGRRRGARAAALPRRPEGAAAARAHGRRGSDRRGLPRPDRLRREPRRRARDPRPSAGAPDDRRLPARGDGHRRPGTAAAAASRRATSASSRAI